MLALGHPVCQSSMLRDWYADPGMLVPVAGAMASGVSLYNGLNFNPYLSAEIILYKRKGFFQFEIMITS